GYHCELAEHGSDALSRLSAGGIDLVITDHDMPVMDGVRFLGEVSKNSDLNIPVIMVTGSLNERLRKRVLAAGAYAVLSKPCSYSMIMSTVAEALKTPPPLQIGACLAAARRSG
ncbi:MAG: response regulator, partial [Nitrospiraceae bacterium]